MAHWGVPAPFDHPWVQTADDGLWLVSLTSGPDDEARAFVAALDAWLGTTDAHFALVVNTAGVDRSRMWLRRQMLAAVRKHTDLLYRYCAGVAIATPSAFQAAQIQAFHFVLRPRHPHLETASLPEAMGWAREQLDAFQHAARPQPASASSSRAPAAQ